MLSMLHKTTLCKVCPFCAFCSFVCHFPKLCRNTSPTTLTSAPVPLFPGQSLSFTLPNSFSDFVLQFLNHILMHLPYYKTILKMDYVPFVPYEISPVAYSP